METPKTLRRIRPRMESYDQKLEQRATKHEFLRDRNNTTTCRSPGHKVEADWKSEMHQKRQMEFQRRRNLSQDVTPQDNEKNQSKVTMRTNRQRVPLVHRQSLISAETLGITWPDVHSVEKATWINSSPLHEPGGLNKTGQLHRAISQTLAHTHQQSSLVMPIDSQNIVRKQDQIDLVKLSSQLEQRTACCQTEHGYITVKEADLIQLAEYLQEALWREDSLKQKLTQLQLATSALLLSHNNVWKNCYKEDKMKVKLDALESKLKICVQRLSRDGAKMLLLQSEQQREELKEVAVATLQRMTDQTAKAQDRAHSLQMALQNLQAESSQLRERLEEEKRTCSQLRTSQMQSIDHINLLQSQLESVKGQEATLRKQLLQYQLTEADLHLKIKTLEDHLNICSTQLETLTRQQHDTKKEHDIQQDSTEHPLDEQFNPAVSQHHNKKQTMMGDTTLRRKRRCRPCAILSLFLVIMAMIVLILLLANIPTRNQLWELYKELQDRTEKYLDDMTLPQHCYRPL
ncbi:hypothetical protein UPYG_G00169910 [Umbra pygmaea]|uniref:TRAF3 interacting protein 3 n=1 Tax=Umbra pygmaea TaxID=75934 RepID=A0ABD0XDQ8_UMBPY